MWTFNQQDEGEGLQERYLDDVFKNFIMTVLRSKTLLLFIFTPSPLSRLPLSKFFGRLRAESTQVHLNNRQNEEINEEEMERRAALCIHVTQLYQIIPQ